MHAPDQNKSRDATAPALDPATLDVTEEPLAPVAGARGDANGLTPDGRLKSGRLAGLTMRRAFWVLFWPLVLESLLTSLVGMTDTYLAAQISVQATEAIGGASYLMWFVGLVVMAVGVGATALISRSVGARRLAVANAAVGQTVLLAVGSGALVGGFIALVAPGAASLLDLGAEAKTAYVDYMRIVAAGAPAMALLSCLTACARGAGDALRPLLAMVVVNVINMVVSWILAGADLVQTSIVDGQTVSRTLLHNPFRFDMGVRGIAWGTVIAEVVGMLIVVGILIRGRAGVRLRARRLRPHLHTMRRLIRVGLPNFFETFGMWIGNYAVILLVGLMKQEALLGSHIIAIRLEAFSFGPGFAIGMAASILAGQYLGAGSPAMARRAMLWAMLIATVQMGLMGIVFMGWGREVTGLISSQPEHLHIVPGLLFVTGMVQVPFAIGIVLRVGMRGVGDGKWVMYLTWISTYAIRLPLVYFFSKASIPLGSGPDAPVIHNPSPIGGTLEWVWIALCADIVIRCFLFTARFLHGGWLKNRV